MSDVAPTTTAVLPAATGVSRLLQAWTEGVPDGVWSAPGRVNLIGEHTDYNGGLALPIALPQRTYVAVQRRDDGLLNVVSDLSPDDPVEVAVESIAHASPAGWASYVAGVLWAMRQDGYDVPGATVRVSSDVPVGAGLSSSAALECAVAAAYCDLLGLPLLEDDEGRATVAGWCQRAENVIAGAPTGGMDQAASMRCQDGHAILLDCRSGAVEQVPVELAEHGLALLVVDTRAEHALVDGQYANRRETCERAAQTLGVQTLRELDPEHLDADLARLDDDVSRRRVRHVVTEIARVRRCVEALRGADFDEVGRLFVASHRSLRDDYEVSCRELDLVVQSALDAGALGARMTGGGFGGSAIALVRTDDLVGVADAVAAAFSQAKLAAPQSFSATASAAAGRDR